LSQAYRLVLELIYRDLVCQLDCVAQDKDHNGQLHKDLELGSFRTFPGSHRNVSMAHQTTARSRYSMRTYIFRLRIFTGVCGLRFTLRG
jgi:hypothetical protein